MTAFSIFLILIILVALLLVLVIMVQNPKGGGLSSSFGGGAQVGGVQNTTNFLDKSTWILAALFLGLILVSGLSLNRNYGVSNTSKILDENSIEINKESSTPAETPDVAE